MPLQIRTYSSTDHGALHELLRDPGVVGEYQRLVEMGDFDDPLSHPVLFPGGMWLACDGADVLGFAMLHYMPSGHGPWAHVRMAVRSTHRRRGVGSALLDASLRWARLKGAKKAWLQVEADNQAAIELYRKAGFTEVYRYLYRTPKV